MVKIGLLTVGVNCLKISLAEIFIRYHNCYTARAETGYPNIPKDKGKLSVDKIYSLERNSSLILLLWKKVFLVIFNTKVSDL